MRISADLDPRNDSGCFTCFLSNPATISSGCRYPDQALPQARGTSQKTLSMSDGINASRTFSCFAVFSRNYVAFTITRALIPHGCHGRLGEDARRVIAKAKIEPPDPLWDHFSALGVPNTG